MPIFFSHFLIQNGPKCFIRKSHLIFINHEYCNIMLYSNPYAILHASRSRRILFIMNKKNHSTFETNFVHNALPRWANYPGRFSTSSEYISISYFSLLFFNKEHKYRDLEHQQQPLMLKRPLSHCRFICHAKLVSPDIVQCFR